jgi:hypothetical protein
MQKKEIYIIKVAAVKHRMQLLWRTAFAKHTAPLPFYF